MDANNAGFKLVEESALQRFYKDRTELDMFDLK